MYVGDHGKGRSRQFSQIAIHKNDLRYTMRLDKYLKISRLIKRRTVANEACDNGRVTLNGRIARASAEVKPGDIIGISFGNRETRVEVLAVQENVRKEAAADLFRYLPTEETSETSAAAPEQTAETPETLE